MNKSIVILVAAVLAVAISTAPAFAKNEREEINQVYEVGKDARLSLSNLNGDARITGWDKGTIEVKATKVTSGSRDDLDEVTVHFDMNDDHLRIEVEYEDDNEWNDDVVNVEFEIRVPRSIEIESIKLVNGSLDIVDVSDDVEASSVNGDVTGEKLGGEVRLSTVNGDVFLSSVVGGEPIQLKSVNGSVSLVLPKNVNAKLSASTVHGDIRGDLGNGVTHAGSSMDAVLGSGGARIQLGTVNGDIKIRRADGDNARKRDRDSDDDSE